MDPVVENTGEEPELTPPENPATKSWFRLPWSVTSQSNVADPPSGTELSVIDAKQKSSILSPLSLVSNTAGFAVDSARTAASASLITAIRAISRERDRDEVLRWMATAREILASGNSTTDIAANLYRSVDTIRFAQLLANTVATTANTYLNSDWPLALKVALPVAAMGVAVFGAKGAGILAMGTGIGMPVVVLLFLGTAGATTVLEAFIRDKSVRDPLTKLMLTFVEFDAARRAKKELLDALRADAMVPKRAEVPAEDELLLSHLQTMDPVEFERHVMSFFERDGFPVGMTPRSNDFGVDGYVMHPDGVIIVQCKRYSADNPVGRPSIQQFKGVIEEQQAYRGYFVTTSRFTGEAVESAQQSTRITLVDGAQVLAWHKGDWQSIK